MIMINFPNQFSFKKAKDAKYWGYKPGEWITIKEVQVDVDTVEIATGNEAWIFGRKTGKGWNLNFRYGPVPICKECGENTLYGRVETKETLCGVCYEDYQESL